MSNKNLKDFLIVVDSSSNLSEEEAEKFGFAIIPFSINAVNKKEEITKLEKYQEKNSFLNIIKEKKLTITTSQTQRNLLINFFDKFTNNYKKIIYIILSKKFSLGHYNSCENLVNEFKIKKPKKEIFICDLGGAGVLNKLYAFIVHYFLNRKSKSVKEVIAYLEDIKKTSLTFAVPYTLDSIVRSGRFVKVNHKANFFAAASKLLRIHAIIKFDYEKTEFIDKAIGWKRAITAALNKLIKQLDNEYQQTILFVSYFFKNEVLFSFLKEIVKNYKFLKVIYEEYPLSLIAHLGFDAVSFTILKNFPKLNKIVDKYFPKNK